MEPAARRAAVRLPRACRARTRASARSPPPDNRMGRQAHVHIEKGPCHMAVTADGLAQRALIPDPLGWIVDMRAQAWSDGPGTALHGAIWVCRYFSDGTSATPYTADLDARSCRGAVMAGLRHFTGSVAALSQWPDMLRAAHRNTGQS
jgi:hypothetical protein